MWPLQRKPPFVSWRVGKPRSSRHNGTRSSGPVTADGKAKSSRNAVKHGLTSNKAVVLQNENPEDYARLAADFAETFQRASLAEGSLLQEMINAQWKRQRAEAIETGLMDLALCAIEPELGSTFDGEVDESVKIALAYRKNFDNGAKAAPPPPRALEARRCPYPAAQRTRAPASTTPSPPSREANERWQQRHH